MSTKLYNGLRLNDSAPDLFTVTKLVSQRMRTVFQDLATAVIAEHVARIVDSQTIRDEILADEQTSALSLESAAAKRWLTEQRELNPVTTFHDPLRFNIVFGEGLPRDEQPARRLAYVFAGRPEYMQALLKDLTFEGEPLFLDYHYQNQTDEPEDIPEDEWEQRRIDWDFATSSEDDETDGTFGHLPGWALPDTIAGVFGSWLFWKGEDGIDLDAHQTQRQRFTRAVKAAAWKRIWDPEAVDEDSRHSTAIRLSMDLSESLSFVLSKHEEWALEVQPDPLPPLRTRVAELPDVYVPPTEFVEVVIAHFRAREKEIG